MMKINLLYVFCVLLCFTTSYFITFNFVKAATTTTTTTSNTVALQQAFNSILNESKARLNDLETASLNKQTEIIMIQMVYDSLSDQNKATADLLIKKAQTQLSTLSTLSYESKFKMYTSGEAIAKMTGSANPYSNILTASPNLLSNNLFINRFVLTALDGIIMIKPNYEMYSVGITAYGSLGCGATSSNCVTNPCKVVSTGVLLGKRIQEVKSEGFHTVVLTTDSTLATFGYGLNGGLGNGKTVDSYVPGYVDNSLFMDKQIKQVEVGVGSTLIVTTDGKMYGWGYNAASELCTSQMRILSPILLPSLGKKIVKVFLQKATSIFITEDGQVYGCGRFPFNSAVPATVTYKTYTPMDVSTIPTATDPIEDVAIGIASAVFRTKSGDLYSVGANGIGQLGLGDTATRNQPELISFFKTAGVVITKVCAGPRHFVALSSVGKVYQWGTPFKYASTAYDQLDTINAKTQLSPTRFIGTEIENFKIVDISCGAASNVAISDTGVAFGWGRAQFFGFGSINTITPVPTRMTLP